MKKKIEEMLKEAYNILEQKQSDYQKGYTWGQIDILTPLLAEDEGEGWISVEERLPENAEDKNVLIYDGEVYVATYFGDAFHEHNAGWDGTTAINNYVTHWMTLPKAPSQPQKGEVV